MYEDSFRRGSYRVLVRLQHYDFFRYVVTLRHLHIQSNTMFLREKKVFEDVESASSYFDTLRAEAKLQKLS